MSNKLHIVSLGCNKNLVDTEVMLGRLKAYELTDDAADADVIIVNTCGFIDAAKTESINTMLNLDAGRKEDSVLVMAGCMSERYKEELSKELTEVDIFTGVGDYAKIDELLAEKQSRFSDTVYLIDGEERVVTGSSYHAYVKISEGCNQACSFCAIPSFKGKLNSRDLDSIAKEVEGLVAKGYYDFSFISQDSSSFSRKRICALMATISWPSSSWSWRAIELRSFSRSPIRLRVSSLSFIGEKAFCIWKDFQRR